MGCGSSHRWPFVCVCIVKFGHICTYNAPIHEIGYSLVHSIAPHIGPRLAKITDGSDLFLKDEQQIRYQKAYKEYVRFYRYTKKATPLLSER